MLKELVSYLVQEIVTEKDKVVINETTSEEETKITISVADSDMGRIIGKQGRVLNAIRTLARSSCKGQKMRVYIDLLENK